MQSWETEQIKFPSYNSDLLVFVDADLAVLSGDGGQLHADVAVLVPAEEARLGHQGEHGTVHPGPLDHHHRPVEWHLDLESPLHAENCKITF